MHHDLYMYVAHDLQIVTLMTLSKFYGCMAYHKDFQGLNIRGLARTTATRTTPIIKYTKGFEGKFLEVHQISSYTVQCMYNFKTKFIATWIGEHSSTNMLRRGGLVCRIVTFMCDDHYQLRNVYSVHTLPNIWSLCDTNL